MTLIVGITEASHDLYYNSRWQPWTRPLRYFTTSLDQENIPSCVVIIKAKLWDYDDDAGGFFFLDKK